MKNSKREIWKDVPGYKNYYQVSDEGRVRSLDRIVLTKRGERFYKGKIMEGSFDNKGYKQVTLSRDGKTEQFRIHQLVAVCFLNHTPDGNTLVLDHINGVKTDNRAENLQIVTQRENLSTCFRKDRDSFSSNYIGVNWDKVTNKWQAQISIQGKRKHLGRYNSELEAHEAYKQTLKQFNSQSA